MGDNGIGLTKENPMERPERNEIDGPPKGDSTDYGLDFDKRLSVRIHQRHIDILDAVAREYNKNRGQVTREIIDVFGEKMRKAGVIK